MSTTPWYQEFFGEDYYRMYGPPVLGSEGSVRQAEQVAALLARHGVPARGSVLDLCCGYGRLAVPLAQSGYRMAGLDLSDLFLQRARSDAEATGVSIRWTHSDMREIPFEGEFDAAINIFTSFGYLEDEEEDRKVLLQVRKALKPGGVFLLECAHRDAMLRIFAPSGVQRRDDGLLILEERRWDPATSREDVLRTLLEPDGRRAEYRISLRLYTPRELALMLESAGLQAEAFYGGLDAGPLTLDSRRLAIVGRRS